MDIVLLEGLGVSDQVLERHSRRLEGLGHVLTVYEKNTDPKVQEERCRAADVVMLANMPLALSAVEKDKESEIYRRGVYRRGPYSGGGGQKTGHRRQ